MSLLFLRLIVLVVQFLVGVIIILGAEFLAQALLHTAATHGQIVPAADQQANKCRQSQARANDLHHHTCSFAHNHILLLRVHLQSMHLSYTVCSAFTTKVFMNNFADNFPQRYFPRSGFVHQQDRLDVARYVLIDVAISEHITQF